MLKELDQKFYYWSVLGGVSRKLRVLRFPRGEKNGITGRLALLVMFEMVDAQKAPSPSSVYGS